MEQRQISADYKASVANQGPDTCGPVMKNGGLFEWLGCFGSAVNADGDAKQSEYDLEAQQDMAEWAFLMALLTLVMTVGTLVGVYFVRATLQEAQKTTKTAIESTDHAREAVSEARKATAVAEKASFEAKEASDKALGQSEWFSTAEIRAYVFASGARINWRNDPFIEIQLTNSGITPATKISIEISKVSRWVAARGDQQTTDARNLKKNCPYLVKDQPDWFTIFGEEESNDACQIAPGLLEAARGGGQLRVGVEGVVWSTTIFKERIKTSFRFFVAAENRADADDQIQPMLVAVPNTEQFEIVSAGNT